MELLLLIVATLVVFYECFKLINMSDFIALESGVKKYKGNDTGMMSFVASKNTYIFLLACEYIYIVVFIYLFFTALYPIAIYMLISMIVFHVIDKVKGTVDFRFRYLDSILTIVLIILAYVFLVSK